MAEPEHEILEALRALAAYDDHTDPAWETIHATIGAIKRLSEQLADEIKVKSSLLEAVEKHLQQLDAAQKGFCKHRALGDCYSWSDGSKHEVIEDVDHDGGVKDVMAQLEAANIVITSQEESIDLANRRYHHIVMKLNVTRDELRAANARITELEKGFCTHKAEQECTRFTEDGGDHFTEND